MMSHQNYMMYHHHQQGLQPSMWMSYNPAKERFHRAMLQPREIYSTEAGTDKDNEVTRHLENILDQNFNQFDGPDNISKKQEVLISLQNILDTWSEATYNKKQSSQPLPTTSAPLTPNTSLLNQIPPAKAPSPDQKSDNNNNLKDQQQNCPWKCILLPFGSYRLGVHSPIGDIDIVCVAPKTFTRENHFFKDFLNVLRSNSDIKDIEDVREAYVPVIKMKFRDVQIDLVFVTLPTLEVEKTLAAQLKSNNILQGMDECSVRSLNGRRANDLILDLVPNQESFRLTLRAVKLWCSMRGIYGNRLGFLGGISCAILVAKICQLYPNLPANRLLKKFFMTYSNWVWSEWPIFIEDVKYETGVLEDLNKYQRVGDEENVAPMRVLTPAFPCMNTTYNVSMATLAIIESQLKLAHFTLRDITSGKKEWKDLFKPINFYKEYKQFFEINVVGRNCTKGEFTSFKGYVESKLRKLTEKMERHPLDGNTLAGDVIYIHLYPQCYHKTDAGYEYSETYYYGMKLKRDTGDDKIIDMRDPISEFYRQDLIPEHNKGISRGELSVRISHLERHELPDIVFTDCVRPTWAQKTTPTAVNASDQLTTTPSKLDTDTKRLPGTIPSQQ